MKYTVLGKSNLEVSRIAFGTWQLGGDWGPTDADAATEAIRRASEMGVTIFDTAQGYGFGQSEQLLAAALHHLHRDDFIIATKGGLRPQGNGVARDASAAWIRKGVEASLRSLDTDYVDLYQLHWPDPNTPVEETAEALGKLVADGKILHVGVSNFNVEQMEAFSETLPVETLQPPYHLFRREIETEVLPYTAAQNIGVLVYGPLAHGLLGGHLGLETQFVTGDWRAKSSVFHGVTYVRNLGAVTRLQELATHELGVTLAQLAVAWTLSNAEVDVAIVGTRNPEHVDEALGAAELELSADVLQRIEQIMADTTPVSGPSPEMM
jgi:aryl-alcohol dehydrogenase-like predicted oxidoreductase